MNERLEKVNPATNTYKYYEVRSLGNGQAITHWGRIGTKGTPKPVTEAKAQAKLREKLNKGYVRVGPAKMNVSEVPTLEATVNATLATAPVAGFSFSDWLGD